MAVSSNLAQLRNSLTELPSISNEVNSSTRVTSGNCNSVRTVTSSRISTGSSPLLPNLSVPCSFSKCNFLSGESCSVSMISSSRTFVTFSQKDSSALADYIFDERTNGTRTNGFSKGYSTSVIGDDNYKNADYYDSDDEATESGEESDSSDELAIANLGLCPEIEEALIKRGILKLFPIQEAVMSPAMEGKDVIARARTGTGKTLAFGIPIIERLTKENKENPGLRRRGPRSLVLAPTRELAKQVEREFCESAPNLNTICVYGGVSIDGQIRQLRRGVDVAVGTPGRIIDLINRGSLELGDVRYLVLDEADQMLAVGFEEDVETILEKLPPTRQTSLFSATMPAWVKKLSRKYLKDPLIIDLVGDSDEKLATGIKMMCVRATMNSKRSILSDIITVHGRGNKTIVFTQTKRDADEVAVSVGRSLGCEALHGDISQFQREKTLQGFREGRFSVLVATDVAARGLDVPDVDLVVHYEAPNDAETFVHRTGRTGRAGKQGSAILMYTDSQVRTVNNIERDVGCKFDRLNPPTTDEVLDATAQQASEAISRVHPDLIKVFLSSAESLLETRGVEALAAAIAHMSGFTQPPPPRSLITFEEGVCTVRIVMNGDSPAGPLDSPRVVLSLLSKFYRPAADSIGKIKIISDRNVEGAVFDVPEKIAKELVTMSDDEMTFDLIKQLPRLIEDAPIRGRGDMYGRFSSQGKSRSFGGRGSYGGDRGSYGGDRGSYGGDRGYSGGGDRGYASRGSSSGSSGRYSDRPRTDRFSSGGDSWGGRSSSRPTTGRRNFSSEPSFGSDEYATPRSLPSFSPRSRNAFDGVCFLCKKSGHRAAECPSLEGK